MNLPSLLLLASLFLFGTSAHAGEREMGGMIAATKLVAGDGILAPVLIDSSDQICVGVVKQVIDSGGSGPIIDPINGTKRQFNLIIQVSILKTLKGRDLHEGKEYWITKSVEGMLFLIKHGDNNHNAASKTVIGGSWPLIGRTYIFNLHKDIHPKVKINGEFPEWKISDSDLGFAEDTAALRAKIANAAAKPSRAQKRSKHKGER